MTRTISLTLKGLRGFSLMTLAVLVAALSNAQTPQPRIQAKISMAQTTRLKGSLNQLAQERFDAGAMPTGARMSGVTIAFSQTAAQQAAIAQLIADQQNPSSPLYHQWLTPEQYAARFGMAQSDIDKVKSWLQQQGFTIDSVARSRTAIRFSGAVGQVNQAFGTQMHYYNVQGEQHFSPSTELSVPSALTGVILGIRNLNNFRPRSMRVPRPAFTSSQTGNVFFTPGDIKVAYDVAPLAATADGSGQSITIVGQSAVAVTDIENFQSAAGLVVKDPKMILVPGTGTAVVSPGDEGESDLDLEWSGAMAPGATINFVYTGSNTNNSVFDAINYAVDQKIGNIISVSYGTCETVLSGYNAQFEPILQQAATQGQTVLAASGDSGSSACYGLTGLTTTQQQVLDVSYPASSPYVTAVGGTEVSQANSSYYSSGSQYWSSASNSDVVTSALKYLPEVAWNDEAYIIANGGAGLSATGGGVSTLFPEPAYQKLAGVPGTLIGTGRNVPDISLYSSPIYVGYLYCTSDQSDWGQTSNGTPQAASCNSGFRDSSTQLLTAAGGTSFATPVMAGMVALINQQKGYTTGQGQFNTTLYTLASNPSTYSAAFHDTTSGNNECVAGSTYCSSTAGTTTKYVTGTGYDQVTGLGSIDLSVLAAAWPVNSGAGAGLLATTTAVTATNTDPDLNSADSLTILVSPVPSTGTTPTGSVNLSIDQTLGTNGGLSGGTTAVVALDGTGKATYPATFTKWGSHAIVAQYAGDSTHASSTGTISFNIIPFTLSGSPTNISAAQNSSGTSTITITSKHSYAGTVGFQLQTSSTNLVTYGCYKIGSAAVAANGTASTTLTLYTSTGACTAAGANSGLHRIAYVSGSGGAASPKTNSGAKNLVPVGAAFLGLFFFGAFRKRARWISMVTLLVLAGAVGLAVGCGGGSSINNGGGTSSNLPSGTYPLSLTGTDAADSTATASISLTLTVN